MPVGIFGRESDKLDRGSELEALLRMPCADVAEPFGNSATMLLQRGSRQELRRSGENAGVRAWKEAGGTHLSLVTLGLGLSDPRAHIETFARFKHVIDDSGVLA